MSLSIAVFSFPFIQATEVYSQVFYKKSFLTKKIFGLEEVCKSDPKYLKFLENSPGNYIKPEMQESFEMQECLDETHALTKDDVVVFFRNDGFFVESAFYKADKDACRWVGKRAISQITHNDWLTINALSGTCQIATSVFGGYIFSESSFIQEISLIGLAYAVGYVSLNLFSQWREAKADDFAAERFSDDELKGARRFLMAWKEHNIEERNTFWKQIRFSADGNDRLHISHPSITSRIHKIEKVLLDRNVAIDSEVERQKIDKLKQYIVG